MKTSYLLSCLFVGTVGIGCNGQVDAGAYDGDSGARSGSATSAASSTSTVSVPSAGTPSTSSTASDATASASSTSTTTVAEAGPFVPPSWTTDAGTCDVAALCAQSGVVIAQPAPQQALTSALAGNWALCEQTSVFGTQEAGLSITADGNWYKLSVSGGVPTPETGFDNQGTWTLYDVNGDSGSGQAFQLNLDIAGSGTVITFPAFTTGPHKMRLNNEGVFVADYVACP